MNTTHFIFFVWRITKGSSHYQFSPQIFQTGDDVKGYFYFMFNCLRLSILDMPLKSDVYTQLYSH